MAARILSPVSIAVFALLLTGCDTSRAEPGANIVSRAGGSDQGAGSVANSSTAKCELRLELPLKAKALSHAKVRITNVGDTPVTLVMPGDGSDCRWRTPIVAWSFLPVDSKDQHPKEPPRCGGARCGNINPLKADEVFALNPGDRKDLNKWIGFPFALSPGKYRAVFYYSNVPDLKWSGLPLGNHHEDAMRRIERSTPISLVSNEVQVEIIE